MIGTILSAAMLTAANPAICTLLPARGAKMDGDLELSDERGHGITFENGGGADAIVKLRHADTGKLAASFFLEKREKMEIEGVPDGTYRIQYAFGGDMAADCKSFVSIIKANQFPQADTLKAEIVETASESQVNHTSLSYTLYLVPNGEVKPVGISAAAFNAE